MNIEYSLIVLGWLITIVALIKFIPKDKIREAHVVFLFKQIITWLLGLTAVELHLIEYPVRIFTYANKTSFSFEYFIYPAICAIFCVNYPKDKGAMSKVKYYLWFSTILTGLEILVERYTDILEYIHWTWYITWISFLITFYISRKYYEWFFKLSKTK